VGKGKGTNVTRSAHQELPWCVACCKISRTEWEPWKLAPSSLPCKMKFDTSLRTRSSDSHEPMTAAQLGAALRSCEPKATAAILS
jgi:hypothetical protein